MIGKIISSGQTGVDRAALDFAPERGIPCGGSCPKGRLAEDGSIPSRYPLVETASNRYAERTEKNVETSDGTLILYFGILKGGTLYTREYCEKVKKPFFEIDLTRIEPDVKKRFAAWAKANEIRTLNIAGPRESQSPGAHAAARTILEFLYSD